MVKAPLEISHRAGRRKIDAWRIALPDGSKAELDVHMVTAKTGVSFSVTSEHQLLKGLSFEGTDLEQLRRDAEEQAGAAVARHFQSDWAPAILVEVKPVSREVGENKYDSSLRREVSLQMHIQPVVQNVSIPIGNRGQTRIQRGEQVGTIVQRGWGDVFERPKSLQDADGILMHESFDAASRVIVPHDAAAEADLAALAAQLEAFGRMLADALSPEGIARSGLPRPDDLVDMMRDAKDAKNEPDEPSF